MFAWIKSHASIVFLIACLLLGIVVVWISQNLAVERPGVLSGVLSALGGSIFAFSLTAFFFSFGDIRNFLEARLAQIISRPDVIENFNSETRRKISKHAIQGSIPLVSEIHPSLHNFIHERAIAYLGMPFAENYHYSAVIRRSESEGLIENHYTLRYRLITSHLKEGHRSVNFRYEFSWKSSTGTNNAIQSWVPEFQLRVGDQEFNVEDLVVSNAQAGDHIEHHAVFDRNIIVNEDTHVSYRSKLHGSVNETIDICKVKYPTRGVRAELSYERGLIYEAMIFKSDSPNDMLQSDEITLRENNIAICTDSWLLPGNGFALSFRDP